MDDTIQNGEKLRARLEEEEDAEFASPRKKPRVSAKKASVFIQRLSESKGKGAKGAAKSKSRSRSLKTTTEATTRDLTVPVAESGAKKRKDGEIPVPPARSARLKRSPASSPPQKAQPPPLVDASNGVQNNASKSAEEMQPDTSHVSSAVTKYSLHLRGAHMPLLLLLFLTFCCCAAFFRSATTLRSFGHIIPPEHTKTKKAMKSHLSDLTLREFLTDPKGIHLAMAPAFFGFYGYLGMLAAWDEGLAEASNETTITKSYLETKRIKSVAGSSAGAMAAVLLAMGIEPRKAADFCSTIDLAAFADFPGIGSFFKGDKFEQLMYNFMKSEQPNHSMRMENTSIPVAVTCFDLQTLQTSVLTKGNVARASRASATFPFLFQPVHWRDDDEMGKDYVLIDGGVLDWSGLEGLALIQPGKRNKRVVNVVVGPFGGIGPDIPPGLSDMPEGLDVSELLSISLRNLPACGPWAMENGPRAVEAAEKAMMASLDLPLYRGKDPGHYELHIDASLFVPP